MLNKRHRHFYIALAVGFVIAAVTLALSPHVAIALGVNAFFLVYLVLAFAALRKMSAKFLQEHAADEDEPALLILLVMIAAVVVSAIALFFVMSTAGKSMPLELLLAGTSVVLGWFASHTMWAMHYAYEYYRAPTQPDGHRKPLHGLIFPGNEEPNGASFLYFSYTVGMTAQTSDTGVASNAMRRLVLVHGVFAFFFNTVIVAAAVNVAIAFAH